MYVIYFYGNDSEVYILIFGVGISLVLLIIGETGLLGLMAMVLIWPIYISYVVWMGGVMDGLKIMASIKKALGLFLIICVSFFVNGLLYFVVLSGAVGRLIGVVSLSFYVYYLLIARIWCVIVGFYIVNITININFKLIILRVLPLPLFFLKVGGIFCMYGIMVLSAMIFLE